jgi:hypothetical protein
MFFVSALSIGFCLNPWSAGAYIGDIVRPGSTVTFSFTQDGHNIAGGKWAYQSSHGFGGWYDFGGTFVSENTDTVPVTFFFKPKDGVVPTDWNQAIQNSSGRSYVYSGNIRRQGGAWQFYALEDLPDVAWRIPDIASINGDASTTVYTAVNLDLYLSANPLGFLGGAWQSQDTLSSLGLDIVNGTVAGMQGIQWSVSPFVFDASSSAGWVPSGGAGDYLNSVSFGYELGIIAEHTAVPEPGSCCLVSCGLIAILAGRRVKRSRVMS